MSQKKLDAIKKAREFIKSLNLPAGPMDEAVDYLVAEVERLRAEVERLSTAAGDVLTAYNDAEGLDDFGGAMERLTEALAKAIGAINDH